MNFRRALSALLGCLLCVTAAQAQKRARAKPGKDAPDKAAEASPAEKPADKDKAAEKPAKPENGEKTGKPSDAPAAATATGASSGDLGDAPPPASRDEGGSKISPLTPEANEFPAGAPPAPPADLDRLLSDITALRSRVAALTTTLFKSKLRVIVETRGEEARIDGLGVTLDDGIVFTAPERFSADDERVIYEHAVAPGQHVVGIDIERYDARNRQYRTWQSSRFSLVVPENQLVEAHFVIEDDSDMAVDFPDDQDGEYEVRVRLRARVAQ